jgi:formylglycine-generating enzyme required for sulfatase activity
VPTQPLYKTIVKRVGDQTFEFVLIPAEPSRGVSRFYMMRDKVTNAQFRRAHKEDSYKRELTDLEKNQKLPPSGDKRSGHWEDEKDNPDWPVRNVTVTEAHCFARWLGGYLPTVFQWDRAGGRNDNDPGPFANDWTPPEMLAVDNPFVAVGRRSEPMVVGTASKDISRYGCRDMAGNGNEWTSTLKPPQGGLVVQFPISDATNADLVELRGQSFTSNGPLLWESSKGKTFLAKFQPYLEWQGDISFRVALEIPRP